jgi:hypothetical protein
MSNGNGNKNLEQQLKSINSDLSEMQLRLNQMIGGKKVKEISTNEQEPLLIVKMRLEGGREIFIKRETFYQVDPATDDKEKYYRIELFNRISTGLITLSPSFSARAF